MSFLNQLFARSKAALSVWLSYWKIRFAREREQVQQAKQTHLHQKRRGVRPPNVMARRNAV